MTPAEELKMKKDVADLQKEQLAFQSFIQRQLDDLRRKQDSFQRDANTRMRRIETAVNALIIASRKK